MLVVGVSRASFQATGLASTHACMRLHRIAKLQAVVPVHMTAVIRSITQSTLCVVVAYHDLSCGDALKRGRERERERWQGWLQC